MAISSVAHMSSKLALAAYALAGTGTVQERLIMTWEQAFERITKKDIPPDLARQYEEIDSEFKRVCKQSESQMPHCLLELSDDEAIAIAETIIWLALEFAKLQGMKTAQK